MVEGGVEQAAVGRNGRRRPDRVVYYCKEHGEVKALWKKDKSVKAGVASYCRYCNRLNFKAWQITNAEYNRARYRAWYEKNREKKKSYQRARNAAVRRSAGQESVGMAARQGPGCTVSSEE